MAGEGLAAFGLLGMPGAYGPSRSGGGVALNLPGVGAFAAGYSDARYGGVSPFQESSASLGAAIEVSRQVWLGTNQRFLSANPGDLRGWSMDLGLQAAVDLPAGLGDSLRLGLNFADAASSLVWSNGLDEVQPLAFQAGLGWTLTPGSLLLLQNDWIDRGAAGTLTQWRAAAQAGFFGQALILRAGATQSSGSPELFASGGLGSRFDLFGQAWSADYAMIAPTGPSPMGTRHLASLSLAFKAGAPEGAAYSKVLKDPRTGRIHHAKINLAAEEGSQVREWELRITNAKGEVVRTFKGRGALPSAVSWDGKGDTGGLVDSSGLSYNLRTTSASGRKSERRSLLGQAPVERFGLGTLDSGEDAGYGLREGSGAASKRASRVRPNLRSGGDFALKGAEFDLSDLSKGAVDSWELRIVDDQGNTVKKFSGTGKPPKNLKWEGKSDLGSTMEGSAALGAGFVLRVVDDKGRAVETADDLVGEADFRRVARTRAAAAPGGAKAAPRNCRRDPSTGGWICTIGFALNSAQAGDRVLAQVKEAARLLSGGRSSSLEIRGYADRRETGEAGREALSQERADTVMRAIVEGFELRPDGVTAKGYGDSRPLSDLDMKKNARVEVLIHD